MIEKEPAKGVDTSGWKGSLVGVGDLQIYCEMHGSGPPLICLHNFSSNARTRFLPLVPILAEHYTCYLVDLRGHGRSNNPTSPAWTHDESAWDIIRMCKVLGIERARFLAASSGGMAMLRVARYAPKLVSAMVVDSSTYRIPIESRRYYKSPDSLSRKLVQYYEQANEIYGPSYGPVLAQTFYDFRLPECDVNVPLETLREIEAPTLLIGGDRDLFFPVEIAFEMKRTIPNSELLIFPNTGHIVMEFFPEMVAEMSVAYFNRHTE